MLREAQRERESENDEGLSWRYRSRIFHFHFTARFIHGVSESVRERNTIFFFGESKVYERFFPNFPAY